MNSTEFPADETERLATLHELGVLNTTSAHRFDHLARMAKQIFDVPIVLVNLLDEHHQWFSTCIGLAAGKVPQEISFCDHAILSDDLLIVPDALMDDRFVHDPLVKEGPQVRFYAGCPLRDTDGVCLGTLCLMDKKPRDFDAEQQEILRGLAVIAEHEIAAVELATVDELTGISNRRGFIQLAQHSLDLCLRQQVPVTLIRLKLVRFKSIKRKFGQAEGDRVLSEFAELMKRTVRVTDLCASLKDGEFVILLINASEALASEVLIKLKRSFREMSDSTEHDYNLSFAYGVVEFDVGQHGDIQGLLDATVGKENQPKKRSSAVVKVVAKNKARIETKGDARDATRQAGGETMEEESS